MGLFRKRRRGVSAQPALPALEDMPSTSQGNTDDETVVRPSVGALWRDGFGSIATRSLQIIIVLVLVAAAIWGLRELSTVFIPIVLALIFASTFWPVTKWLRARGVPAALAATLELLSILLILTGVGWLVSWAVREQWDELSSKRPTGSTSWSIGRKPCHFRLMRVN